MSIVKLKELHSRLKALHEVGETLLKNELVELSPIIEDLNIKQLQHGKLPNGEYLPNYSSTSVKVYHKPAGPIKLYETGATYRGIQVVVERDGFEIEDTDSKWGMLVERYGTFTGLTTESWIELRDDYLIAELRKRTRNYLWHGIQ